MVVRNTDDVPRADDSEELKAERQKKSKHGPAEDKAKHAAEDKTVKHAPENKSGGKKR